MTVYLNVAQIVIGVALVAIIVMQTSSGTLSGVFGGSGGSIQRVRRGPERTLFIVTIILSILFFGVALASALIQSPA